MTRTRSVPFTTGQSPQFAFSRATDVFASDLKQSLNVAANEMRSKSEMIMVNSFLTESRKAARDIYNKNINDPDQLSKELGEYKKGLLSKMPSQLRPRLDSEYGSLAEKYLDKATSARNKALTQELTKSQDERENQILNDLQFAARDLFSGREGLSQDEIVSRNATSFGRIATDFDALDKTLSAVGADGQPLKNPKQVIGSVNKAKEYLFSEVAKSWLDSRPDKLTAYSEWLDSSVVITLPEGQINIRDVMTPEVRSKVDKELIQNIKNDIYIENQQAERSEAELESFVDETKKILYKQAEDGTLSPATVDAYKNVLEFSDFRDFSKMAREANPVTNGNEYAKLINKLDAGFNIDADLQNARFNERSISNEDYERLLTKQRQQGVKGVVDSPVQEARDFLLGALGDSATVIGIAEASTIARAERDFNDRILEIVNIEGREPTRQEALEISDEVFNRYNVIQVDKYAATLPKPVAMDASLKLKFNKATQQDIDDVVEKTVDSFVNKYNGDLEKARNDEAFKKEMKLIEQYQQVLKRQQEKKEKRALKTGKGF